MRIAEDEHRRSEGVGASAVAGMAQAARASVRNKAVTSSHSACSSREYTQEQVEFGRAMEKWKRFHGGRMPTVAEILRIAKSLGYSKRIDC